MKPFRALIVAAITLMPLVALPALSAELPTELPTKAVTNPYGANYFPNFPVVTQDGKTLNFYDDVIKGKRIVVSFIYTSCPDMCPLTTARLTQVEDELHDEMGHDLFFVSMTVDPEHDTPAKLKAFSKAFGTGPGWLFLTGKPEDIRAINARLGDKSRSLSDHRNEIVLGNDNTGEWARNTVFGDIDRLVLDIHGMDPAWENQERVNKYNKASDTGFALGLQPGQSLFKKICAPCHTIGVGDRVGPDLRGVTERRSPEWLTRFIRSPGVVRAEKDPTAMENVARFPGVRMPNLGLTDLDVIDLVAFLRSENARIEAGNKDDEAMASHHRHSEN
jgi:protein SCO1/2